MFLGNRYSTSKMSWPWNPGQTSLKVIGTDAYDFLLTLRCNHGPSDIPVTETQTDTEMIDISITHTETNTEKIFNTDTIYI